MDEDKDEHDEEKLRKARDWDEWKDSKFTFYSKILLFTILLERAITRESYAQRRTM